VRIWKRPLCGDVEGDPFEGLAVECGRRKNHRGDHRVVVRWPQRVPLPPRDPNAPGLFKPEIWGKVIAAQLQSTLIQPIGTGRLRSSLNVTPYRVTSPDTVGVLGAPTIVDDPADTVHITLLDEPDNG